MTAPGSARITTVTFDLGGVLIDWDPRYLYRTLFDDEAEMEAFLAEVTTQEWNAKQDAGRTWSEAVEELATRLEPTLHELTVLPLVTPHLPEKLS